MRGIVIAKMLVLTLWGVYLAVGLLHETDLDEGLAPPLEVAISLSAPMHARSAHPLDSRAAKTVNRRAVTSAVGTSRTR
jgi:hypothetical protein